MPDSPSPYSITFNEGLYHFTTSQGRSYTCVFTEVNRFLPPLFTVQDIEVYYFDFFFTGPKQHIKWPNDDRIAITIKTLLNDFFQPNRVLIYVCDSSDGKGRYRNKVFKNWFKSVEVRYKCNHIEIDVAGMEPIYGAVIRSNEFQHEELLEAEVIQQVDRIVMEKFGLAP
ncbi:MAG: DUF6169 family protein [Algoriphagus sp.]|nr:DUF6169 family protein [Algoriphagus sp.]